MYEEEPDTEKDDEAALACTLGRRRARLSVHRRCPVEVETPKLTSGLYPARREIATGHSAARAGSQSVEQTALGLWVLYGAKVVSEHASAVDLVAWDGYCAARNAKNLSGVWHFGVG